MKHLTSILILAFFLAISCTSQQKLAYLGNLPEIGGEETFTIDIPDYTIQPRDILSISAKAMTPEGRIQDFLSSSGASLGNIQTQGDAVAFFSGYDVNSEGNIVLPVIGSVKVSGLTLSEIRDLLQETIDKVFRNTTVECKLLSFKFTVIGEVRVPGAYINYNNYLTVLEAIGRAGGVGDYGDRNNVLVVRPVEKGSKTYRINLQDKHLLTSQAYFLLPNDVVIVQPMKNKIFSMNLPTISFILTAITSTITTTLLLINYMK